MIPYFMQDIISSSVPHIISHITLPFKDWIAADPIRPLHQTHARFALYGVTPPGAGDPGVVGQLGGFDFLLDGYHRAVRFWYGRNLNARFRVWQPIL